MKTEVIQLLQKTAHFDKVSICQLFSTSSQKSSNNEQARHRINVHNGLLDWPNKFVKGKERDIMNEMRHSIPWQRGPVTYVTIRVGKMSI